MADKIEAELRSELANTPYKPALLNALSGGTANFIFRATPQEETFPDGRTEVIVKHGEAFVASMPDFALTTSRCDIEQQCLRHVVELPHSVSPGFSVGTPKVLYYNAATNTQVQECLSNATNLKDYCRNHFAAAAATATEQTARKDQCLQLGRALGAWLRSFHTWSDGQAELREVLKGNKELQALKQWINYKQLVQLAEQSPEILGDAKEVFQAVGDATAAELEDEEKLVIIHGDFWTGNILLPNQPFEDSVQAPVWVIDWEMASLGLRPLDVGQMIAELWQLKLYKDIDAGPWLIEGFVEGYTTGHDEVDEAFAMRVILHVGAHLVCFGSRTPGWGTPEQQEEVMKTGRDLILQAWRKDRRAFDGHVLACLFA